MPKINDVANRMDLVTNDAVELIAEAWRAKKGAMERLKTCKNSSEAKKLKEQIAEADELIGFIDVVSKIAQRALRAHAELYDNDDPPSPPDPFAALRKKKGK